MPRLKELRLPPDLLRRTAIHLGSGGLDMSFELGRQHGVADKAIGLMVEALSRHMSLFPHAHVDGDDEYDTDDHERDPVSRETATAGPLGLMREERSFDNAVKSALLFVKELPDRRLSFVKDISAGKFNPPEPWDLSDASTTAESGRGADDGEAELTPLEVVGQASRAPRR